MHPDLCEGRVVVVLANVVTCEQIFLTFPTEWMCVGPVMKGAKDRMPIDLLHATQYSEYERFLH